MDNLDKYFNFVENNKERILIGIFGFVLLLMSFNALSLIYYYFNIEPDNPVEEYIEDMIEDELNVEIDLTP